MTMPALGESVTEGTVTRWLKAEGDEVAVDEPLLEVSTDKVDTEIPSPVAGTLTKILVQEDETVPVGADLAVIGGSGRRRPAPAARQEQPPQAPQQAGRRPARRQPRRQASSTRPPRRSRPPSSPQQEKPRGQAPAAEDTSASRPPPAGRQPADAERPQPQPSAPAPAASGAAAPSRDDAAAYVTPLVRKLAAEHGVDLGSLKGTGVGGRIRKQDVLDAAEAAARPPSARPPQPRPSSAGCPLPAAPPAPRRSRPSAAPPRR